MNARSLVVVDDATGSDWSRLPVRASCGARNADVRTILPPTVGEWRSAHPDTNVRRPPAAMTGTD